MSSLVYLNILNYTFIMKRFFLIAQILVTAVAISAQIPVALDRLEGRWTSGNTISDWHFTDDYALNNRVCQVIQGDTVEISTSYIRADKSGNTTLTYITPHGENHQFRLVLADAYGLTWRNVQTDELPTCIKIERSGPNQYTWSGLGETTEFKHEKEGRMRLKLGISLGMNHSVFPKTPLPDKTHGSKQGLESAVSLNLSRTNSAFGLNLETGYIQLNNTVEQKVTDNNNQTYTYRGEEQTKAMYAGIIPEGHFGKKGQFVFSTGILMTIAPEKTFNGGFINNTAPSQQENLLPAPSAKLKGQTGLLVGMGYQPGFKLGNIKPVFYCRYIHRTSVSAGVKMMF